MERILDSASNKTMFIYYSAEDESFAATVLRKTTEGVVLSKIPNLEFIGHYPALASRLSGGKTLYIDSLNAYIGTEQNEGPYGENKIFVSEYESTNGVVSELIVGIDNNIKVGKKCQRTLTRIGDYYRQ